jgi:tripartite-type tricarboxylate transporter receptor subunit TctC
MLLGTAVLLAVLSFGAMASAADFPKAKQLRMVVPYGAGGGVDISTRILATPAQDILGQRIDVVCMPGAGGQEGINFVLQQPRDGYTLLVTDYGPLVTTALTEEVTYDLSDWVPLVQITEVVPTFFVLAESPLKNVEDWVKAAKEKPESLTVAHGRHLSVPHLPLILFEKTAGIKNTHVPTRRLRGPCLRPRQKSGHRRFRPQHHRFHRQGRTHAPPGGLLPRAGRHTSGHADDEGTGI